MAHHPYRARALLLALALCLPALPGVAADVAAQNDLLNAELWMRTAVEYRANCLAVYALAKLRLDEALADKSWTAYDQPAGYQTLPPAVILDLDETALDNSPYEASLVVNNAHFEPKTWNAWVKAERALAVPGAVDFARDAAAKGVTVFYVSNRDAAQKDATRRNLAALGFPLELNVDTLLMRGERPEWTNAKSSRLSFIAKDYRVLLLFGDQLGDFSDKYNGTLAERDAVFAALKAHFGRDWMMLANPVYGSFEGAPYGQQRDLSDDERRARKLDALAPWSPPR